MNQHIAIVEDEPTLAASYRDLLNRRGYTVSVYTDAPSAVDGLANHPPDLALLDVGLGSDPEAGFDLCRTLRTDYPMMPIVFLTARDTEIDIISGLRLGADDYLTKSISNEHLLARVTGLLRRVSALLSPENSEQVLRRGGLELNTDRLTVAWQSQNVALTFTEFWMLHALAKHPGHIKNRDQLMAAANVVLDDSTITSHIRRIRRKFEAVDESFGQIETAYGLGYRWLSEKEQ